MNDTPADPLSQLITDTDELDRQKLSDLLSGYCVISKEGQIRPITNFPTLNAGSKMLVIILAQKAAHALGLADTDQISPKQIESISGLPGGTIRSKLMELRQKRIVDSANGNYSIPNHSILHVSLNTNASPTKDSKPRIQRMKKTKNNSPEMIKLLRLEHSSIGEKRLNLLLSPGKYLERSLAVLAIAREAGIESLSPADITQFLKEKVRANALRENISMALMRGTKYVDRFRLDQGGAYGYKIMVAGDQLLEKTLTESTKE